MAGWAVSGISVGISSGSSVAGAVAADSSEEVAGAAEPPQARVTSIHMNAAMSSAKKRWEEKIWLFTRQEPA